jgi:hypothetical protein
MKLNKTKTFILVWVLHIYIYYTLYILFYKYVDDSLYHIGKDDLMFFLMIPLLVYVPIVDGLFIMLIPIIAMYYFVWHKKCSFFKSYVLSNLCYYFSVNFIYFLFNDLYVLKSTDSYYRFIVYFICLIITIFIIWLIFHRKFKKLDEANKLKYGQI